jgi:Sigma-70 region 2
MIWDRERDAFDADAQAALDGQISEGEFLRRTRPFWRRIAVQLWRRWRRKLPSWVEIADIRQELQILAIQHLHTWDPGRGLRIGAYVVWVATKRAQRQIHRWRGAKLSGNESRNKSRVEINFTRQYRLSSGQYCQLSEDGVEQNVPARFESAEDRIERGEKFDEVMGECRTVAEAVVLLTLRECDGSVQETAAAIWENFRVRVECGLQEPEQARALVGSVVSRLVVRHEDGVIGVAIGRLANERAA